MRLRRASFLNIEIRPSTLRFRAAGKLVKHKNDGRHNAIRWRNRLVTSTALVFLASRSALATPQSRSSRGIACVQHHPAEPVGAEIQSHDSAVRGKTHTVNVRMGWRRSARDPSTCAIRRGALSEPGVSARSREFNTAMRRSVFL